MKTTLSLFFLFLVTLFSSPLFGEKKALIIAVGDYPEQSNWGKISSEKDVPLIFNALLHHGFLEGNILIIQDTLATKTGIIDAFKKITRDAESGDILVIHYSGHGQQLWDKNGDELDGRDESIVPIDAPAKYIKGVYEGERHLSDDELEVLVGELRVKLGSKGSLTLIFDACHSGTATRGTGSGMAPGRGTTEFMGPAEALKPTVKEEGTYNFRTNTRGNSTPDLAPMVLFSGAGAAQLNYETQDEQGNFVGSLSYALSKTLLNCRAGATYKEIFDQVKTEMAVLAPKQSPQIEGDIGQVIFGGKGADPVLYFKSSKVIDQHTCMIQAGNLMGVFNTTRVGLFPKEITDIKGKQPIAYGTITNATLGNADVVWDTDIKEEDQRQGNIYITAQSFGDIRVKVKLDLAGNEELAIALQKELKEFAHVVVLDERSPDLIVDMEKGARGSQVQLVNNTDEVLFAENSTVNSTQLAGQITKKILAYTRARFLRELNTQDPSIDLAFELIPITAVEEVEEGSGRYKRKYIKEVSRGTAEEFTVDNMLTLKEATHFKIKITNRGDDLAYFCLLDIQPDNEVNILIPGKGLPPEEFKIKPGESIELENIYTLYPPYGVETFKLIATKEPVDLRTIVNSRGAQHGNGTISAFGQLLQSTYKEQTRGGGESNTPTPVLPPDGANVFTLVFRIVKK